MRSGLLLCTALISIALIFPLVSASANTPDAPISPEKIVERQTAPATSDDNAELLRPGVDASKLPAMSIGLASKGRLINGKPLPFRKDWVVRSQQRQYGTPELIDGLEASYKAFRKQYPKSCRLITGDISRPHGGPLLPHRSHQSGRDIDIGLFAKNNREMDHFEDMTAENLDPAKTWALIETILENNQIEYILLDYSVQEILYRYVRFDLNATSDYLERVFQYPRPIEERVGIIRHVRGHKNHLHIRWYSPDAVKAAEKYENLLEPDIAALNALRKRPVPEFWQSYVSRMKTVHGPTGAILEMQPMETLYMVAEGESLWSISKKFDMDIAELCTMNNLLITSKLKAGQEIKVIAEQELVDEEVMDGYVGTAALLARYGKGHIEYTVREGDTLWSVAQAYDLKIADLCQWNGLSFRDKIRPGQTLMIMDRPSVYANSEPVPISPAAIMDIADKQEKPFRQRLTACWQGFNWDTFKNIFSLIYDL